jgi:hypothetical protein
MAKGITIWFAIHARRLVLRFYGACTHETRIGPATWPMHSLGSCSRCGPKAGKGDKTGTAYRDFQPVTDYIASGSDVDQSCGPKKKCGLSFNCHSNWGQVGPILGLIRSNHPSGHPIFALRTLCPF